MIYICVTDFYNCAVEVVNFDSRELKERFISEVWDKYDRVCEKLYMRGRVLYECASGDEMRFFDSSIIERFLDSIRDFDPADYPLIKSIDRFLDVLHNPIRVYNIAVYRE
jgi:hypothetical protein